MYNSPYTPNPYPNRYYPQGPGLGQPQGQGQSQGQLQVQPQQQQQQLPPPPPPQQQQQQQQAQQQLQSPQQPQHYQGQPQHLQGQPQPQQQDVPSNYYVSTNYQNPYTYQPSLYQGSYVDPNQQQPKPPPPIQQSSNSQHASPQQQYINIAPQQQQQQQQQQLPPQQQQSPQQPQHQVPSGASSQGTSRMPQQPMLQNYPPHPPTYGYYQTSQPIDQINQYNSNPNQSYQAYNPYPPAYIRYATPTPYQLYDYNTKQQGVPPPPPPPAPPPPPQLQQQPLPLQQPQSEMTTLQQSPAKSPSRLAKPQITNSINLNMNPSLRSLPSMSSSTVSMPLPVTAPMVTTPPPTTAAHSSTANNFQLSPNAGQIQPPGSRPKITTTMWEDEKTLCYQVEANNVSVVRRADNNMINGTKLLNVAKMTRGRRDGILKAEKTRHVVKVGSMHLKGVWIPFERALIMAKRENIADSLYPLFVKDIQKIIQQGTPTVKMGQYALNPKPNYPSIPTQGGPDYNHLYSMGNPLANSIQMQPMQSMHAQQVHGQYNHQHHQLPQHIQHQNIPPSAKPIESHDNPRSVSEHSNGGSGDDDNNNNANNNHSANDKTVDDKNNDNTNNNSSGNADNNNDSTGNVSCGSNGTSITGAGSAAQAGLQYYYD